MENKNKESSDKLMNKIIIFGAGKLGHELNQLLDRNIEKKDIRAADSILNHRLQNRIMIDIYDKKYIDYSIIMAISKPQSAVDVYMQLKEIGYKKIFWYNPGIGGETREGLEGIPLIDCRN